MCLRPTHTEPKVTEHDMTCYKAIVIYKGRKYECRTFSRLQPVKPGEASGDMNIRPVITAKGIFYIKGGYIHMYSSASNAIAEYISTIPDIQYDYMRDKGERHAMPVHDSISAAIRDAKEYYRYVRKNYKELFSYTGNTWFKCLIKCTVPAGTEYWEDNITLAARKVIYPE